jgi:DNA-binding CsgD family transcriptional regulator
MGLSIPFIQKSYTASALYRKGTLKVIDIGEQLNISIPTLYNYIKHQNIALKVNSPTYEIINTVAVF